MVVVVVVLVVVVVVVLEVFLVLVVVRRSQFMTVKYLKPEFVRCHCESFSNMRVDAKRVVHVAPGEKYLLLLLLLLLLL